LTLIHFDHLPPEASDEIDQVDRRLLNISLPTGSTISARYPDRSTIEELEAQGRLGHIPPELLHNGSVATEGLGSGGHPRTGALLFEASREQFDKRLRTALRRTRVDARRWAQIKSGEAKRQRGDKVMVFVVFNIVGGMHGALPGHLTSIYKVADDLGVDVKVILVALPLGTIEPANPAQARRNQERILSYLLAEATGRFFSPHAQSESGRRTAPLCDSLILLTNRNRHGEISQLAALRHMIAQMLFLLTQTPAGEFYRERIIDLENNTEADRCGAPRCASTASLSVFSADRNKASAYCANRLGERSCRTLLQTSPREQIAENAVALVRRHQLVESDDESLASERLSRPAELRGESTVAGATAQFRNRLRDSRGWERFVATERAWQFVIQTSIPANLQPLTQGQAQTWVAEIRQALRSQTQRTLRSRRGPADLVTTLRGIHTLLGQFETANKRKTDILLQAQKPRLEGIEQTRRWGERLKRRWCIVC